MGAHAEGENLYLGWEEWSGGGVRISKRGGKGGEDEDEGRVGVRSDNRPKHHKQPRRSREEAWMGTGMGALYSRKDFGNLVSAREE
jgi:hypothetical protein